MYPPVAAASGPAPHRCQWGWNGYHWPVTVTWQIFWEVALLACGGVALWLFFGHGWYRLHRAPRRPTAFTPLVGGGLLVAMVIAGQIGGAIAVQAFGITPPPAGEDPTLADTARILLGAYAAQGIVLVAFMHLLTHARKPLNDNRMKPAPAMALGLGALLLFWPMVHVVSWIAARIAAMVIGETPDPLAHSTLAALIASGRDVWFLATVALVVIAAPVLEEVLYRGILQETLKQLGLGSWTAIFVTSAIFAVMHAAAVPPWALVSLFALSLGFGWAYERTGRLAAPIVMHVLFNAGNIVLAMLVH